MIQTRKKQNSSTPDPEGEALPSAIPSHTRALSIKSNCAVCKRDMLNEGLVPFLQKQDQRDATPWTLKMEEGVFEPRTVGSF